MKTRDLVLVALFAALTAVGSWISIPIQPVPFTFQVFFVLLAGAMLGSLRGGLSQFVYLLLGAVGLPVFAGGSSGLGALAGPTGGYIFGFVAAAAAVGAIVKADSGYARNLAGMVVGVAIIYIFGLLQLMYVAKLGLAPGFMAGVASFIPFDLFKAVVATALLRRLQPLVAQTAASG